MLKRVFSSIDLALMQSDADAHRIRELGMPPTRIVVTGNLKFDSSNMLSSTAITNEFRSRFNLGDPIPLIVAASTHDPEELMLIDSLRVIRQHFQVRLLLAPRHPERFQEVAKILDSSGFSWSRRTNPPSITDTTVDVILLDTIGELPATYSLGDIVFVGGSIVDRGGHNLLEPAATGACIVTGAYTHNFRAVVGLLVSEDAVVQLPELETKNAASTLGDVLFRLLSDQETREAMGQRAKKTVDANRGATARTIEFVRSLLDTDSGYTRTSWAARGFSAPA